MATKYQPFREEMFESDNEEEPGESTEDEDEVNQGMGYSYCRLA